jgi:hypothetical protein
MRALWLLLLCGCPPEQVRNVDSRDVTRCEHGRGDDQYFIKQTWKACDDAARSLIDEVPGSSLRYSHKACDLGYIDGCLHWLDYVYKVMPRDPEVARPELEPARAKGMKMCKEGAYNFEGQEYGTSRACFYTARLYEIDPKDEEIRKELDMLGCKMERSYSLCAGK